MDENDVRVFVSNTVEIAACAAAAGIAINQLMGEMVRSIPAHLQPKTALSALDNARAVCTEVVEAVTKMLTEVYMASGVDLSEVLAKIPGHGKN